MNDSPRQAPARATAVHYAIADMWPDDHDAMLADMECRTLPSSGGHPDDHRRPSSAVGMSESSMTRLVATTIAEMWPDDEEAMNAFGVVLTAGASTGATGS